jgi:hypothetical protein
MWDVVITPYWDQVSTLATHEVTLFLASQGVLIGDPHRLVHASPHLRMGNDCTTICNIA